MQIRDGCVFRERAQRLTEGYPEQDDKGEKTYQATRARGLARLMPAMLRQKRQLTCVHGDNKTPVGSLVASVIILSSSTINNLRSTHTISRCSNSAAAARRPLRPIQPSTTKTSAGNCSIDERKDSPTSVHQNPEITSPAASNPQPIHTVLHTVGCCIRGAF